MAHGIMEFDRGIVQGESTWHGLPQYQVIADRSITFDEAMDVARYPLVKCPVFREKEPQQFEVIDDQFCITRFDKNVVLVPAVGSKFELMDNSYMLNKINEGLLYEYPDLKIESAGTLFNGATFFLNLRVGEFRVKGDASPTVTNLMFSNPLGRGSYVACAHNTRIVCNNTERAAEAQGVLNASLKKFRHTRSAATKIQEHLLEMAELQLELKKRYEALNWLARQPITDADLDAFLDGIMPLPEVDGRTKTIAQNSRKGILDIVHGRQHQETLDEPMTKYGLYMAFTDWVDHGKTSRNSDEASITYDGLLGGRADQKEKVYQSLVRRTPVAA